MAWGLGQREVALWRLGERDQRIEEDGQSAMWVCGGWVNEGNVGGLWWRVVPVSVTSRE